MFAGGGADFGNIAAEGTNGVLHRPTIGRRRRQIIERNRRRGRLRRSGRWLIDVDRIKSATHFLSFRRKERVRKQPIAARLFHDPTWRTRHATPPGDQPMPDFILPSLRYAQTWKWFKA